jgi:hypothetical protein
MEACKAKFRSGPNKGKPCTHPATSPEGFCGHHATKKKVATTPTIRVIQPPRLVKKKAEVVVVVAATAAYDNYPRYNYELPEAYVGNSAKFTQLMEDMIYTLPDPLTIAIESVVSSKVSHGVSANRLIAVVEVDNTFYVCNVKGSSRDKGAWKKFWLKHTTATYPRTCRAKDCERDATATGHMYWRDDPDQIGHYNYLVPICSHHNSERYDSDKEPIRWFPLKKGVAVKILENQLTRG